MSIFEFLEHSKTKYMENRNLQIELEETLFQMESYEKWRESLIKRSQRTREIYLENEALIKDLKEYLKEDLTKESAKALYDVVLEMYENECDDYPIMRLIIDKILPYYLETSNYGKLVKIYHMLAFEYYEAYGRTGKSEYIIQSTAWYKKVISYKSHYTEIEDADDRIQIFIAYSNLIAPFGQMKDGTKDEIFDIYDEVLEFFNRDYVQELDGNNEDFLRHIEQIKEDIFFVDEGIEDQREEIKNRFYQLVDSYEITNKDMEGSYFRAKLKADLLRNLVSPKDTAEKITAYIESLPMPDYRKDPNDNLLLILNYHNNAIDLYDIIQEYLKDDDNTVYIKRILKKVMKVHTKIPYGFYTQMMNNVCQEFYRDLHGILKNFKEKLKLLLKLILVRQPTTYIHSLMVSEIATQIASRMLEVSPEVFIGNLGYNTLEDVVKNKDKILSYVERAGLLHDVGKCFIVEIVNRQNRRLVDEEFSLVKEHPALGLEMIEDDKDFKEYFDIMVGHHKWYNDMGGYPSNFMKKDSKYAFFIDLITIADCIDAATDILGRNYTSGKNFDTLYQELERDKGTRYNPVIVDFIKENMDLYQALGNLTGEGRALIYYKAYQEILSE